MRFALSPEGRGATGEYNSGNHKEDCSGRDHTLQHRQGRQMDPMTMDELNLQKTMLTKECFAVLSCVLRYERISWRRLHAAL